MRWFRSSGADLPFGDPLGRHWVAMEGYFWRFTDATSGRTAIALCGVNRSARGPWATLGVATSPGPDAPGELVTAAHPTADARHHGVGAYAGDAFSGDGRHLRVRLPGVEVDVELTDGIRWPRRRWGASSVFHCVPRLNQYWHPWLLGGRAHGRVRIGDDELVLDGAETYGEKNWGGEGFPESWWWGQAQGFGDGACVAFAGGDVTAGPFRTEVTALVVRLPDGRVVRLGDPGVSPVRADVTDDRWDLAGRGLGWDIEVHASAPLADGHVLPVPLPSENRNTAGALEHLAGTLETVVRHRGREVWRGRSTTAGLEHGSLALARDELRRRGAPADAVGCPPRRG